jgi:hypothetical protein
LGGKVDIVGEFRRPIAEAVSSVFQTIEIAIRPPSQRLPRRGGTFFQRFQVRNFVEKLREGIGRRAADSGLVGEIGARRGSDEPRAENREKEERCEKADDSAPISAARAAVSQRGPGTARRR